MLTPALRVENRIHRPHGPHLCEHRPLSGNQRSSSPECTDPQRWRPSRRQPPHERGVLRARLLRPAGRHAMVVAHFFESGQRRRLRWGRVESAPLMAGAVALASTGYIAAIDEKAGRGHVGSARASRVPHSVSRHCPRRQLESRVREAQGRVILLERGWIAAQLRPPGQAVVRRTVPLRSLDDWLVPACYQ